MNAIQFLLQHLDTILTLLSIVAVLVLGLVYITKNGRNFINAMLLSFVTITAELTAIIERITSDEGKAVTMELLKSVAELCGIDTSQFKKKADAVAALQSYIK